MYMHMYNHEVHDAYPAEQSARTSNYAAILHDLYARHNPEKVKDIPDLLNKYRGNEEALIYGIIDKYNPVKVCSKPCTPMRVSN